jgi:hypothetical protein
VPAAIGRDDTRGAGGEVVTGGDGAGAENAVSEPGQRPDIHLGAGGRIERGHADDLRGGGTGGATVPLPDTSTSRPPVTAADACSVQGAVPLANTGV